MAFNKGEIVRKDLVEKMKGISVSNKLMNYGYGCMITDRMKERGIGHGGSVPNSFSSQISYYTDSDLTIIVLSNDIRSIKRFVPGILVTQYMERVIYEKIMSTKLSCINKLIF